MANTWTTRAHSFGSPRYVSGQTNTTSNSAYLIQSDGGGGVGGGAAHEQFSSPQQARGKVQITPTRFWRWFDEDEFEPSFEIVASGHFGQVKKAKFKGEEYLQKKKQPITYAGQLVALKDPKGNEHDFVSEQYALSHEVSCTLILHPSLVNYIGGVYLKNPARVGIVIELLERNLRSAIEKDPQLRDRRVQLSIAKQIASGMNFLHSLNPLVLHRDLRTPNILVSANLECKIADFGISNNLVYENFDTVAMYTSLIPSECIYDQRKFTIKGDVYFYGWILVEMLLGKQPDAYDPEAILRDIELVLRGPDAENLFYKQLIFSLLHQDLHQRPKFNEILFQLNSLLGIKYDLELIAQHNLHDLLVEGIQQGAIGMNQCDALGRNMIHYTCIFGNVSMLEFLTNLWGKACLFIVDKFQTNLCHFAARNGHLNILQFLESNGIQLNEKELRFQTSALDLAIAMKHWDSVDFLISRANQETIDSALLSASSEGNLELVQKLVAHGANLECRMLDIGVGPLDRAAYNGHYDVVAYLLSKGANVNQTSTDGRTALWNAAQNGHLEIVQLLARHGGNVNRTRDDDGVTALFIAAQNGRKEIVEFLLKNGADPNKARTDTGGAPLLVAAERGHKAIVELLLSHGADVNDSRTVDGVSALFMASQEGHTDIVEFLLNKGADANKSRVNGTSPLLMATVKGHYDVIRLLLQKGADKNKQYFGRPVIYYAQREGRRDIIELLQKA